LGVLPLGAFNQIATIQLENILETKVKRTINIWGKRIVAATTKGSFNIWLKKNGWIYFVKKYSLNITNELEELEDDDLTTEQRKQDYMTELSRITLV
jgi:hypothetical protein